MIQRSRSGQTYGLILGTLGRQGNRALFDRLRARLEARGKTVVRFLMAEISPVKLQLFPSIDVRTETLYYHHNNIAVLTYNIIVLLSVRRCGSRWRAPGCPSTGAPDSQRYMHTYAIIYYHLT